MRKILISTLLALAGMKPANAQYTFTLDVSWSGNCGGYTSQMNQVIGKYKSQAISGFPTYESCEQVRKMCQQELGHIELVYYDLNTGKVIKKQATNCKLNVIAGSCTGRPLAGNTIQIGVPNINGVSQGTTFYSTNSANEIRDWSSDDMERMLALNRNYQHNEPTVVSTGDPDFDNVRSGYMLSGSMPGGSLDYIEKPHDNNNQELEDYMIVGGARIPVSVLNKPFNSLGEAHSDDLKFVNIELKPVESLGTGHYDNEEGFVHKAFRTIDEKMDWYESENPNVFQYMYTKWGKDNVIAGVDWWERNDVSNRLENAYNTVEDAVSNAFWHPIDTYNNVREGAIDKLKENVEVIGSTICFFLPPQYKNVGDIGQETFVTHMSVTKDAINYIKNSPDAIERGEAPDFTPHLKKYNDEVHNLAISAVNPGMSKSVRRLQAVEDIYNLPKDKQKKGLTDLLKREGKGIVKSEIKKSEKYQKLKKKGRAIVDPYNFIFD